MLCTKPCVWCCTHKSHEVHDEINHAEGDGNQVNAVSGGVSANVGVIQENNMNMPSMKQLE